MTAPRLSVIIAALDESAALGALLGDVELLRAPHEVIVVDGGSSDDTVSLAARSGATIVHAERGRGTQLRTGADAASAPLLCFLHADVRLPLPARETLDALALRDGVDAWAFRLKIDGHHWGYRLVEWSARVRSSLLALPYGDQGLVIGRGLYDGVGGFADVPLMEDVLIARALQVVGGIGLLGEAIVVSPRRWDRVGLLRRSVRNLWLLARVLAGAPPAVLARGAGAWQQRGHDGHVDRPAGRGDV